MMKLLTFYSTNPHKIEEWEFAAWMILTLHALLVHLPNESSGNLEVIGLTWSHIIPFSPCGLLNLRLRRSVHVNIDLTVLDCNHPNPHYESFTHQYNE